MNQIVKKIFETAMEGEMQWKKGKGKDNDYGYERNIISVDDGDEI